MVQDCQGLIADRAAERLMATDAAVVRFRRVVLGGATALERGDAPAAALSAEACRLRSGSWVAHRDKDFPGVMRERFAAVEGRAP